MKFLKALPKIKLQQLILVTIISLIVVSALGQFYLAKLLSRIEASNERIADLAPQVREAEANADSAQTTEQSRQQMLQLAERVKASLITGDPFSWIVRELSLLAENHPVEISSLRPGAISRHIRNNRYEVYNTSIEVTAGYDDLGRFLSDLENRFPTGSVRDLELTGAVGADGNHRATVQLTLMTMPTKDTAPPTTDDQELEEEKPL